MIRPIPPPMLFVVRFLDNWRSTHGGILVPINVLSDALRDKWQREQEEWIKRHEHEMAETETQYIESLKICPGCGQKDCDLECEESKLRRNPAYYKPDREYDRTLAGRLRVGFEMLSWEEETE